MVVLVAPIGPAPAIAPITGNPGLLLDAAQRLGGAASRLISLSGQARSSAESLVSYGFSSPAGASFLAAVSTTVTRYTTAAGTAYAGSQALATYAAELKQAQEVVERARAAAELVEQQRGAFNSQLAAAQAAPTPEPGATAEFAGRADRIQAASAAAQRLGADAHQMADRAAIKAAAALRQATEYSYAAAQERAAAGPSGSTVAHTVLGVGSAAPGVGIPFSVADGVVYAAEGNEGGAALAALGVIPVYGALAKGGKAVGAVVKVAKTSSLYRVPDDLIRGIFWHRSVQKGIQAGGVSVRFVDDGTQQVIGGANWTRELYLHGGSRYTRLDAYTPNSGGMIMSLKSGQYGTDAAATRRLIASLDELADKYPARASIADVPSTPRNMVGDALIGTQVLGIPVQVAPLPPEVLRHADDLGVRIAEIDVAVPTIVKEP